MGALREARPLAGSSPEPSPTPPPKTGGDAAARPLNVTDALSYLDAVKAQFQDQPDVYNRFLDIMKDFKSELLDTPGVIQRVSMLFQGNPFLIQGFNTFLPPGYRIDCSADPRDTNITVTTPDGVITQSTQAHILQAHPSVAHHPSMQPFDPLLHPSLTGSRPTTPSIAYHFAGGVPFGHPPMYSPGLAGPNSTAAAASYLGAYARQEQSKEEQNKQFQNAIQYLNKIKSRFSEGPEVYKQFLEILQSQQKASASAKDPRDTQVYAQVTMLFKDAPDLFDEFKYFLPEIQSQVSNLGAQAILPQPGDGEKVKDTVKGGEKKVPAKRRKRPAPTEKEQTPVSGKGGSRVSECRPKTQHKPEPSTPPYSPYQRPATPPHAQQQQAHHRDHRGQLQTNQLSQHAPTQQQSAIQQPPIPHFHHAHAHLPSSALDAVTFFDTAKILLESRGIYGDFLKLLDMFGHDMIDTKTLIQKAEAFIGDAGAGDLMKRFKEFVGYDEHEGDVEMGPPGSIRTGPPDTSSAKVLNNGESPSYRRLPETENRLACSGRDQLCKSVLNNEWVSNPVWASEDSGFVTHRKNGNEEALHKTEEERHEFHVILEAMSRTIVHLEALNLRIDEMANEERAVFRLRRDLGGYSKAIYQKTIKKVYGEHSWAEIWQGLQDCPSVAVPVVLTRLRRKEEEWKRIQREYSPVWREIDARNFYRSLDYQASAFKQKDKGFITAKFYVTEIEAVRTEQLQKRAEDLRASFTEGSPGFQLEYDFSDAGLLTDSLELVHHYLQHHQLQYGLQERRRLSRFMHAFIPLLLMQSQSHQASGSSSRDLGPDEEESSEGNKEQLGGGRSASGVQNGGVAAGDLRTKLLETARERRTVSAPNSRSTSPGLSPDEQELQRGFEPETGDVWIHESASGLPEGAPQAGQTPARRRPFFANERFYTLLRLIQTMYSRLNICKEQGARHAAQNHEALLPNPVAVELGLEDPNGPASVLERAIATLSDGPGSNVLWKYLHEALVKLWDGEMDTPTFEEQCRWFFGHQSYYIFTLDKLIIALIKQVHTIFTDTKSQELWFLLQKARRIETPTTHDIIRYRREAERWIGSADGLYRIEWDRLGKVMRIQLVGPDDASVDEGTSESERWREYIDTFITRHRTEWMPSAKDSGRLRTPFMRRCLPEEDTPQTGQSVVENRLAIRISLGTYKIFYEAGTEDFVWQRRTAADDKWLRDRVSAKHEERKQCRLLQ
ncbi:hypothetical protein OE88DRAFT_1620339 [Heliocybe sulcata]|uniref:Histone deacetylase interacting domain-containing protein n=1 Tax=Heliocybe sulcata TaxID=5364 RepID=A0A5C3NIN9_9AGAM|nr:hypothetical protein OE88DRAFT_1620339 [Heliocybe sulcata]